MKKFFLFVLIGALQNSALGLCKETETDFFALLRAQRRVEAHTIKSAVAEFNERVRVPKQLTNGDEERYADLRGSFGKALQHAPHGFIQPDAFQSLVRPLQSKSIQEFNEILLGQGRKLVNPQASLVYSLQGNDGWIRAIPPAPAFASAEVAAEMVELYWSALVRDVPFNEFSTNATALAAIANLNTLIDFTGPRIGGEVTPQTFLRGNTPGDLIGPYISQFLYQTIPYGSTTIGPEQTLPVAGIINDFNTTFADWFTVIDG